MSEYNPRWHMDSEFDHHLEGTMKEVELLPHEVKSLIAVWFWVGMFSGLVVGVIFTTVILSVTGEI